MPNRLTAAEAAAQTAKNQQERERQARLAQAQLKFQVAHAAKLERRFKMLTKEMLQAALDGHSHIDYSEALAHPLRLLDAGFAVHHIDMVGIAADNAVERRRVEAARANRMAELQVLRSSLEREVAELEVVVDSDTRAFLARVRAHVRYQELPVTKENVTRRFSSLINAFSVGEELLCAEKDALYKSLFDSSVFMYKPLPEFAPRLRRLQRYLRKLAKIRVKIQGLYADESKKPDQSDPDAMDISQVLQAGRRVAKLLRHECSALMDPGARENLFRIDWHSVKPETHWNAFDLNSAKALNWLSSSRGQAYVNAIEKVIMDAVTEALASVELIFRRSSSYWNVEVDGSTRWRVPSPSDTAAMLGVLGYATKVEDLHRNRSTVTRLFITWSS